MRYKLNRLEILKGYSTDTVCKKSLAALSLKNKPNTDIKK